MIQKLILKNGCPMPFSTMVKKINDIIEELNIISTEVKEGIAEHLNEHNDVIDDLEKRLSDLEQCPVNDFRQCIPLFSKKDCEELDVIKEILNAQQEANLEFCSKLEKLEQKEILKPNYDPDDVKFTSAHIKLQEKIVDSILPLYCKPGTFEWALIKIKNGKKIKLPDSDHQIELLGNEFVSNFVGFFGTIKCEILMRNDWEIVE